MQRDAATTVDQDVVITSHESAEARIDLNVLPFVPAGDELVEHEVYIDALNMGHGPFRALSGQTAGSGNGYVPEADVDAETWDALIKADGEAHLAVELAAEADAAALMHDAPAIGVAAK